MHPRLVLLNDAWHSAWRCAHNKVEYSLIQDKFTANVWIISDFGSLYAN